MKCASFPGKNIALNIAIFALLLLLTLAPATAAGPLPELSVSGAPEIVFSYTKDSCSDVDIPDQPLRAFRDKTGNIVAIASHYVNRALVGTSFRTLHHDCRVRYKSEDSPEPRTFLNQTWLSSLWTDDGLHITALAHNEFHGDRFVGKCSFNIKDYCWYNSITMLLSQDSGRTFSPVTPNVPILASPHTAEADQGARRGYFDPSNVVGFGDYKYLLVAQRGYGKSADGRCLLRSSNPNDPTTWQIYTGTEFVRSRGSPYDSQQEHPLCRPVSGLAGTLGSITRIRGTPYFAAFTMETGSPAGDFVSVFFSRDLQNWQRGGNILKLSTFWSKDCEDGFRYGYPSAVDDRSEGFNFDNIGETGSMFLVRGDCRLSMARDLVRFDLLIHANAAN
jgi:hypothetical protein